MRQLKKILAGALGAVVLATASVAPVMADGGDICSSGFSPEQQAAAGCGTTKTAGEVANAVIQVVVGLAALVAVGVMLYGGVTYTISTGDAAKVARAKHIIMYGLIGLAVCILAFSIVRFVPRILGQTSSQQSTPESGEPD